MLNFYVISAGRDMVKDTDRSSTCPSKFKGPPLKTNLQKVKVLPKTWVSTNNRLKISDKKLKIINFGIRERNKGTRRPQRQQLKMELLNRKKWTKIILRVAFKLKLSKILQDSN